MHISEVCVQSTPYPTQKVRQLQKSLMVYLIENNRLKLGKSKSLFNSCNDLSHVNLTYSKDFCIVSENHFYEDHFTLINLIFE